MSPLGHLIPHEDVHGLSPGKKVLARMAASSEQSGLRLLPAVDTTEQSRIFLLLVKISRNCNFALINQGQGRLSSTRVCFILTLF
jgi:hypothetical protein